MTKIKTIIVDDERKARDGLETLLFKNEDIELIASCKNGIEAIDALQSNKIHLAILDIQMPGINGFEVLNSISPATRPIVVFATAFDQFALKAFEYHAIDYLLKPFTNKRFDEMLGMARTQILGRNFENINMRIDNLLTAVRQPGNENSLVSTDPQYGQRLVIKAEGKIIFIDFESIQCIEANDYYIKIHADNEVYMVRESLKNIETKLTPKWLARIHKSGLININFLKELIPAGHGEFIAKLKSGRELKVSRNYKKNIAELLP